MVSLAVTLHTLSLGAEDVRGQYAEFYVDSTIKLVVEGPSGEYTVLGAGTHSQVAARGFTNSVVSDGDKVTDSFGNVWKVLTAAHVPFGDVSAYYVVDLSLIMSGVSGGNAGYAPGYGIGGVTPLILELESFGEIRVLNVDDDDFTVGPLLDGTVVEVGLIPEIHIVGTDEAMAIGRLMSSTVADIGTVVSVTVPALSWYVDCSYSMFGVLNPILWQTVTDGNTLAVTSVADTANGYVQASTTPFSLDDATYHHGSVDAVGAGSYTVPDQTANTLHQLKCRYTVGWGSFGTTCTPTGYSYNVSAATRTYTAAGAPAALHHWHIWLDGATDLGHSPAVVPAQTNGTYHAVTQVETDN